MNWMRGLLIKIRRFLEDVRAVNRENAISVIEYETRQMETMFALIVFGSFIGMPSPPAHLTMQLMPLMEEEAILLFNSVTTAKDALGELSEMLGEP